MKRLLLAASTAFVAATAPAAATPWLFSYTGTITTWTAPADGTYEIVATGAQGGAGTNGQIFAGGLGARIGGFFFLVSGTTFSLAVGGAGESGLFSGGGGGGSFVVRLSGHPLVIAGGGGGIRSNVGQNGWNANTGGEGLSSSAASPTGGGDPLPVVGIGGPIGELSYGAGGGGMVTNGEDDADPGDVYGTGGGSWANLLVGGVDSCVGDGHGGFGGGGAGGCPGGGGGGGFSGGQGGAVAGGGGSYNADTVTGYAMAGVGYGHGAITISLMQAEVTTPEPASAALSLLGLFALAAIRRRPRSAG